MISVPSIYGRKYTAFRKFFPFTFVFRAHASARLNTFTRNVAQIANLNVKKYADKTGNFADY